MKRFKVFKKLCSLALILSMLVSMIPINVFATEATEPTQKPTIDPTQTGSLTINKKDSVENKPVSGINFSIYQVFSISTGNDGVVTYSVNDNFKEYFNDDDITHDEIDELNFPQLAGSLEEFINEQNATENKISPLKSATTGTDGKAKFESLNLGYYLVIETDSDKVDTVVEPFLVSIPTTVNGEYWEYNVEVTAKNVLSLTEIILKKTDGENLIDGAEFTLQKLTTGTWENGTWGAPIGGIITVTNGMAKAKGHFDQGTYRFVETKQPDGYILDHDNQFVFNVKLVEVESGEEGKKIKKLAFESVSASQGGEFTVDENGTFTLTVNNEKPTVDKEVDDQDVNIGDTAKWTIKATVPSTIKDLKTFTVTDTLSKGLTFDETTANLVVKQGQTPLTKDTEYTLSVNPVLDKNTNQPTGETELVFTFDGKKLDPSKNIITITYGTKVNENAVIGTDGNPNKVKLEYSTVTGTDSDFDDKSTPTPEVEVKVYTFGLNIYKHSNEVDEETGKKKPLKDAVFNLYKGDGQTVVKTGLVTDGDGNITVPGLEAGDYVLVETKAPQGYNLLKEPVKFTITAIYDRNESGKLEVTETNTTDGYITLPILNQKGFTLPETGGMGTVIFTVVGLGMMGLAGAAYIALKRKESQQ